MADGAELVLGPLFAANVQAAAGVVRAAGKPLIAFSTDAGVAARGTYLLSFLPQAEVDRVVDESVASGRKSFAAMIPDSSYGNAVEAQFREAVARKGARLVAIERYPVGNPAPAIGRLGGLITGPARPGRRAVPAGHAGWPRHRRAGPDQGGLRPGRVRPIGTAVWNDPRVFALPALQGGWFAAPDAAGFNGFSQRYQARFGAVPPRVATLAYDAVSLMAALSRQFGSQRFADTTLTNPSGFSGVDGTFRFRPDGPERPGPGGLRDPLGRARHRQPGAADPGPPGPDRATRSGGERRHHRVEHRRAGGRRGDAAVRTAGDQPLGDEVVDPDRVEGAALQGGVARGVDALAQAQAHHQELVALVGGRQRLGLDDAVAVAPRPGRARLPARAR